MNVDEYYDELTDILINQDKLENVFLSACNNGNLELVKELLSKHEISDLIYNGLYQSIYGGHLNVFKFLIEYIDFSLNTNYFFELACRKERKDIVEFLIDKIENIHLFKVNNVEILNIIVNKWPISGLKFVQDYQIPLLLNLNCNLKHDFRIWSYLGNYDARLEKLHIFFKQLYPVFFDLNTEELINSYVGYEY